MKMMLGLTVGLLLVASANSADLAASETRVDPYSGYLYNGYGAYPRYLPAVEGPIVEPGLYPGAYAAEPLVYGPGVGYGLVGKPYLGVPYVGAGYNGGYLKSGINDGALVLGNKGEQLYKEAVDGAYKDGGYHHGGSYKNGGYHGLEAYKDNKHHVADDHANKLFYSGVHGGKSDLGNGEIYDKNQGFVLNSYNALGDNQQKGYEKGHKKTGFRKSYHKDESGNDETYYDSDHDAGNYEFGKKYGDQYGTNFLSGVSGGKKFNEYSAGEEGKRGYFGNGKLVAQNEGLKDYYGKNGYYNNADHYGGVAGARSSELGKFGVSHGYQNGYNNGRDLVGYKAGKFGNEFYAPHAYYY